MTQRFIQYLFFCLTNFWKLWHFYNLRGPSKILLPYRYKFTNLLDIGASEIFQCTLPDVWNRPYIYIYIYEVFHKKVNRGLTLTSQIFLIFNRNHEKWLIRRYPKQKLHIINGFEVRASYVMRYIFFLMNFWKTVIIISFFLLWENINRTLL